MKDKQLKSLSLAGLLASVSLNAAAATQVASFEELILDPETYFNPALTTSFSSGGASFGYMYSFDCCWSEFTYSNVTDVTTPGFSDPANPNDASAYVLPGGGGAGGSANYAVGYFSTFFAAIPRIDFAAPRHVLSAEIANTTYTALSILNGDGFADPFVAGDFLLLIITGLDASDTPTGSIEVALADYRGVTPVLLDDWFEFDLSALGPVRALEFTMTGSQSGTPTYFALDNLVTVPLPGAALLLAPALLILGGAGRRRDARR